MGKVQTRKAKIAVFVILRNTTGATSDYGVPWKSAAFAEASARQGRTEDGERQMYFDDSYIVQALNR
jgi:hypothetical protein